MVEETGRVRLVDTEEKKEKKGDRGGEEVRTGGRWWRGGVK